jgi:hypothetical protein
MAVTVTQSRFLKRYIIDKLDDLLSGSGEAWTTADRLILLIGQFEDSVEGCLNRRKS